MTKSNVQAFKVQMMPFRHRLKSIFTTRSGKRLLFILDDFEQNMELDDRGLPILNSSGRHRLAPEVVLLLEEILAAILSQESNTAPQLIITCRYELQASFAKYLAQIPLTHFRGSEWERLRAKKGEVSREDQKEKINRIFRWKSQIV